MSNDLHQQRHAQGNNNISNGDTMIGEDETILCVLMYRLETDHESQNDVTVMLAKCNTTSGGAVGGILEGNISDVVSMMIVDDPPDPVGANHVLGGFRVIQKEPHQIIYGVDSESIVLAVVTGLRYQKKYAIAMLEALHSSLPAEFHEGATSATKGWLTEEFSPMVHEAVKAYRDQKVLRQKEEEKRAETTDVLFEDVNARYGEADNLVVQEQQADFHRKNIETRQKMIRRRLLHLFGVCTCTAFLMAAIIVPIVVPLLRRKRKFESEIAEVEEELEEEFQEEQGSNLP